MEIGIVLSWPVILAAVTVIGKLEPTLIALTIMGGLTMAMISVATYETWRRPLRRRVPSPKETINAVDLWLRDNGYTRGPASLSGFSDAIKATGAACTVWIAVPEDTKTLQFLTIREDAANTIAGWPLDKQAKLTADIGLEIARMGAFYQSEMKPNYVVTIFDSIPIDEELSEAKILQRVIFIERVDHLVGLLYGKMLASGPSPPPPPPPLPPPPQSTPDTEDSPPQ